ncbi:MAG: hypothetical protein H0X37_21205 [Herpetosiphonaceae bacterium]|nr:hypothetical protein [Herpetosiphonaceae bacterium]
MEGHFGRLAGLGFVARARLVVQVLEPSAHLHQDLVAHGLAVGIINSGELAPELLQTNRRVDNDGFHRGEMLKIRVDIDGVKNAEGFLVDLIAAAGGAAQHLLVEDTAVDPTQEHNVLDRRHVDAGREQVDRYGNLREGIVT